MNRWHLEKRNLNMAIISLTPLVWMLKTFNTIVFIAQWSILQVKPAIRIRCFRHRTWNCAFHIMYIVRITFWMLQVWMCLVEWSLKSTQHRLRRGPYSTLEREREREREKEKESAIYFPYFYFQFLHPGGNP